MQKDLKDIEQKKSELMASMSRKDVAMDGKEFEALCNRYKTLVETEEMIKDGKHKHGILDTILRIGGFAVTVIGVIFVPQLLADKAYDNEKDLKLKNGTIWNLIGKNFGPKDNNKL